MKIFVSIGSLAMLLLSGCSLFEPASTFQIASVDRPVKSASLKLCKQTFLLSETHGRWQTAIHVPGDCDGGVTIVMNKGKVVFCPVGYVTSGDGGDWRFTIKGDVCQSDVSYGGAGIGNGS